MGIFSIGKMVVLTIFPKEYRNNMCAGKSLTVPNFLSVKKNTDLEGIFVVGKHFQERKHIEKNVLKLLTTTLVPLNFTERKRGF